MLKRKIINDITAHLQNRPDRLLVVDGARQIGKSYIIRHVGSRMFKYFIEINMERDRQHDRLFAEARTTSDFYLALSAFAGNKMGSREDTLVFIDEIQAYDHLLTLAKFLMEEGRFTYVASGSLLGVTLRKTQSVPVGYLQQLHMYPLDFEEFLWANGVGEEMVEEMRACFVAQRSLPEALHRKVMDLFRRYLLVGGLPAAVNAYLETSNITRVRQVQRDVMEMYGVDAAKYERESLRKLKIQRIYQMLPSNMSQTKKRIRAKEIENKNGKRMSDYQDEFDYLVSSGIALEVDAISQPTYPLVQNAGKNLLKLYLNDIGLLTCLLYRNNIRPILSDECSVNLGAVYETVVAQELCAHGYRLFYYDNKKMGEVDFLIDDTDSLSPLPIEVKSGKDYTVHSALSRFLAQEDYRVRRAIVFSNEPKVYTQGGITYHPIYNIMFLHIDGDAEDVLINC